MPLSLHFKSANLFLNILHHQLSKQAWHYILNFDELSLLYSIRQIHHYNLCNGLFTDVLFEHSIHQEKSSFMLYLRFCPSIPRRKLLIINKVWELYLPYPKVRLLALPSSMDKTIAHTIGYAGSQ